MHACNRRMKRGFLNDKSNEKNGLGALQDLRSQPFLFQDRVGHSPSGGWGVKESNTKLAPWGSSPWGNQKAASPQQSTTSSSEAWVRISNDSKASSNTNNAVASNPTAKSDQSSLISEARLQSPPNDDDDDDDTPSLAQTKVTTCGSTDISTLTPPSTTEGGSTMTSICEENQAPMPPPLPRSSNPFTGQPLLPNKTMGVPKATLQSWYGQRPERHQVNKEQYVSWNDGGPPHALKFTCLFVCPLTGEIFPSARYGDSADLYVVKADEKTGADVVWYTKKTNAEHGAAARAYDCFSYRQYFGTATRSVQLGKDMPYLEASQRHRDNTAPSPTPSFPTNNGSDLESKVQRLQQKAHERTKVLEWNAGVDLQMADQEKGEAKAEATETEEYRRKRKQVTVTEPPVAESIWSDAEE